VAGIKPEWVADMLWNSRPAWPGICNRMLIDDGREGMEHWNRETGKLLIRHYGNIHKHSRDATAAARLLRQGLETMRTIS